MAWTTPRTAEAGEQPTAAVWNADIRDNWNALAVAGTDNWATYTPTWRAVTTDPTLGNGTLAAAYQQIGRLVVYRFYCAAGSTTAFGSGAYRWDLPVAAIGSGLKSGGQAQINDSGTSTFEAVLDHVSTTRVRAWTGGTTLTVASPTSPMTWASGDNIRATGFYEAAS